MSRYSNVSTTRASAAVRRRAERARVPTASRADSPAPRLVPQACESTTTPRSCSRTEPQRNRGVSAAAAKTTSKASQERSSSGVGAWRTIFADASVRAEEKGRRSRSLELRPPPSRPCLLRLAVTPPVASSFLLQANAARRRRWPITRARCRWVSRCAPATTLRKLADADVRSPLQPGGDDRMDTDRADERERDYRRDEEPRRDDRDRDRDGDRERSHYDRRDECVGGQPSLSDAVALGLTRPTAVARTRRLRGRATRPWPRRTPASASSA